MGEGDSKAKQVRTQAQDPDRLGFTSSLYHFTGTLDKVPNLSVPPFSDLKNGNDFIEAFKFKITP